MRALAGFVAAAALVACGGGVKEDSGPKVVPVDLHTIPDAVPRPEPRSRYGNPKSYQIEGRTYYVLETAEGYKERGVASWYGTKFHGKRTSSGDTYDMFGMTAAHKTLPLPCYARVTRTDTGASVIVKINDRGPFRRDRLLDLSYAAASKLDLIERGSGPVEVEVITPGAAVDPATPRFLEAGVFDDPIEAVAMREQVEGLELKDVEILSEDRGDATVHRVLVGPFRERGAYDAALRRLREGRVEARPVPR